MRHFFVPILFLFLGIHTLHAQALVVSSFSPTTAPVGATVSFQCGEFNGYIVDVFFGGVICQQVSEFDGTGFTAVVPVGALSGPIEIQYSGQSAGNLFTSAFTVCNGRNALTFNAWQGNVGSTLQIYGDGFSNTIANNIVFFGDARATVTNASLYQLTVTVPPGADYSRATALNTTTRITQSSARPFHTTFPSKYTLTANDFNSPVSFANVGCTTTSNCLNTPPDVVDIDGDGRPEVIFSDRSKLLIHRNVSAAGKLTTDDFLLPTSLTLSAFNHPFCFGDLNSDGKPDFVTSVANGLQIRRNQATPGSITSTSFATAFTLPFPANGSLVANNAEVALGDFNRDGKTDIVVSALYEGTTTNQRRILIYENTSTTNTIASNTFKASVIAHETSTSLAPGADLQVADIDGDGKLDILVGGLDISIFRNQSVCGTILPISFAAPVRLAASSYFQNFAVGDLNNDLKPELILATPNITIFQNNSTPGALAAANFAAPISLHADAIDNFVSRSVVCGDFDGDGKLDLFVSRSLSNEVSGLQMSLYRNTTAINGNLLPSQFVRSNFLDPVIAAGVVAADMDKDGKTDLLLTTASEFRIYRNRGNDAYCIPPGNNCGFNGEIPQTGIINGFQLINQATSASQTLSSGSGCSGGYANYAPDPTRAANVQTGQTYQAVVDLTGSIYLQRVKIWGDFNKDSDFEDAGELIFDASQTVASSSLSAPFLFPTTINSGSYRIRVKTGDASLPDFQPCDNFPGETEDYTAVISNYCIPSYTQSCLTNNFFINSVQLGSYTLINAGCNGYRDNYTQDLPNNQFPDRKFVVLAGSSNTLQVGLGITGQVAVWIDYNNDKVFATTEMVAASTSNALSHTFTLTIPTGSSSLGLKRMRVRSLNAAITNAQACATLAGYGETEDFMVEIRHNPGAISTRRDTICNGGTPAAIAFATNPIGGTSFNYDWYYKPGIHAQPSGLPEENGWIFIPTANLAGQTFPNHAPTALTSARTYACFVSPKIVVPGISAAWASGIRQVEVLAPFNPGTITSGDETFCNTGNPSNITLSINPTGAAAYTWRWYWRENATSACPTGSTVPTGWTTNSTSPNITGTTTTGAGISFDPASAGSVGLGRTFAVLITPIAKGSIPACGVPQFAASCRKTVVQTCTAFNPGVLNSFSAVGCSFGRSLGTLTFSTLPTTGSTYAWYYKNEIVSAPGANDPIGTWLPVTPAATGASYSPPTPLSSISYVCRVTNGANSRWASGICQMTILTPETYGEIASGNQTFEISGDPAPITFSTPPAGGTGEFTYQWFSFDGISNPPSPGSNLTIPGWNVIPGANSPSYDPPVINRSTSYAVMVDPTGIVSCGIYRWIATGRIITINPLTPAVVASGNQTICNGAIPASMSCTGGLPGTVYQWYYKVNAQTAPANGEGIGTWLIASGPGANTATYTPNAGITSTRTYVCRVTIGVSSQWATGVRLVTVLPAFNPGTIASGDQTLCATTGNPANIVMSTPPSGSGSFTYRWWYKESVSATTACPTGSSTSGWTITGATGATASYDPSSSGANGRMFALMVTPVGTPTCGTPSFANGCRKIFVKPAPCSNSRMAFDEPTESEVQDLPVLDQNRPNPFTTETTIPCFIPEESQTASLEIFGLDGRLLQQIPLAGTGEQNILIHSKMLPASGMYLYTLVIDGQKQPMMRMVVAR